MDFWEYISNFSSRIIYTQERAAIKESRLMRWKLDIHPVIFRQEHPSILREAFLAMYRYVNVCTCKLISRENFRQILINNFIAVSLGKTNTCIWLNIGRKLEKYEQACT